MSIVSSINKRFRAEDDLGGSPAPWDDFWYGPVAGPSPSGMRVTPDSAKRIAAALACVSRIGFAVGAMPLKVYTDLPSGGKKVCSDHPVYDLLYSQPNKFQTSFEFRMMMQGHFELRGNAYAEILPGARGAVDQLIPLHPDRVIPEATKDYHLRYKYNDPFTGNTRVLFQEEVFHLRNWTEDGINGQSTVSMGADVFGTALAAQDYAARFFANDARPGSVITGADFATEEDRETFRKSWQESQTGRNRHKTAVLWKGMDIKALGLTAADAQLLDTRKFSRIEICSLFGVPPHLIGETEKAATYASVEQFNIMFAVYCLWPRLVIWEQAIQRDLILANKYYPKFSMAALLRGDTASRYAAHNSAIQNGWESPNDAREMEDMNPIPGGDQYFRPMNWVPLTTATPTPGTATGDVAGGDAEQASVQRGRLKLLAISAAERCVRKEVASLRKMLEHNATEQEFLQFYSEHEKFVSEVLRIQQGTNESKTLAVVYAKRAQQMSAFVLERANALATQHLNWLQGTEPVLLADLAMGV
jgi:HK97 family phage portal protein